MDDLSFSNLLTGKTAIITGGAGGVGSGISRVFGSNGCKVLIVDINAKKLKKIEKELSDSGITVKTCKANLTKTAEMKRAVNFALDCFGHVDILVNCVGGLNTKIGLPFTINNDEDWKLMYELNFKSMWGMSREVMPHMVKRKYGKIISLSSVAPIWNSINSPHYTVFKGGINHLTKTLAKEYAKYNIAVNSICPGYLWTDLWQNLGTQLKEKAESSPKMASMLKLKLKKGKISAFEVFKQRTIATTPMGIEQMPEDIGNLACFLASDKARYITGQVICVDGGATL
ncbi:SDR family oxidoreductase [Candidatus Micrarchaeota archaeon]|nr:SDR family oxidoreductase [Candidatus Micrarchaeota archaeon]